MKLKGSIIAAAIAVCGCADDAGSIDQAAAAATTGQGGGDRTLQKTLADPAPIGQTALNVETIAEGLSNPWCIAFLPNGDMLVTERAGRIRIIRDGELLADPVAGAPEPLVWNQSGYFDILPHPDFETNQTVFFAYAHGTKDDNALRVISAKFDGAALSDINVLYDAKPGKDTGHHYGGKLVIGGDDKLYFTIGEGSRYKEKAQDMASSFGAVVRINQDGSIPDDNPDFGDGSLPELYSKGHRNPQGFIYDAATDTYWEHE
ncbi:MAG: PQQ-dependent sugar dehydrogenase, partial [Pseudomonadota bacterium]